MLRKISTRFLFITLLFTSTFSLADEGMWIPMFIKQIYGEMQNKGLKLTPEQIYSVNNSSLKDAIVRLNRGMCTAEMISDKGLMLTNHHCGYSAIQELSTVENNYLDDGFWAMSGEEELPAPGFTASFLVRMEDVTEKVLADVTDGMSEAERTEIIKAAGNDIAERAIENTHYEAEVKSFYGGNEFYLMVYETFTDVRLVGAPPSSIGKFGGDTDNWMWPRHTGDFSIFRVYTDKDGNPADYSKDNIPYKPKHSLPISLEGVKEGDFTMVFGFPGSTERYKSSYGVQLALEQTNPSIVAIREKRLGVLKEFMDKDKALKLQLASEYSQISNYYKYFIGQNKGIKNLDVIEKKQKLEAAFAEWVAQDRTRKAKYGNVLSTFKNGYDQMAKHNLAMTYLEEAGFTPEVILLASKYLMLHVTVKKDEKDRDAHAEAAEELKTFYPAFMAEYNKKMDKKMFKAMMKVFYKNVPAEQRPAIFNVIENEFEGDVGKFTDEAFNESVFMDQDDMMKFLKKPKLKVFEEDLIYQTMLSFYITYLESVQVIEDAEQQIDKAHRLFIAGLREMNQDKAYYPDANSTLRLTYGQVFDYVPRDAVLYDYYTTLTGVIEKEDPTNEEFIVPKKLVNLYEEKEFGQYGEDGKLHVGLISNNDITGGNSGSPVINGKGELIGCAFDGNWEAMSGDIVFEPELQRCISVDIRYILFIIDKFAGASYLLDEMNIVKAKVEETELEPAE